MSVMAMGLIAEESDTTRGFIFSLLKRGARHMVSTMGGLFEASAEEKRWRKLATPTEMESPGILVQGAERSPIRERFCPPPAELIPCDLKKPVGGPFPPDRIDFHLGFSMPENLDAIHTRSRFCQRSA